MAGKNLGFIKMDGLGNDFVILDGRNSPVKLSEKQLLELSHRSNRATGGCDQIIIMENARDADVLMRIYNADGGEVDACGNASRCVAKLVSDELGKKEIRIATADRTLFAVVNDKNHVTVDMGEPGLGWKDIPLAQEMDTLDLRITEGELANPVGVSMGNPHAVFFVNDVEKIDLKNIGPKLEHHKLFPQRANIGAAQIVNRKHIKLRVWERGAGETKACGTGACAALVAAVRRSLTGRAATISLLGGDLRIEWDENTNHVLMTGAVSDARKSTLTLL